jgi:hypothetical protein
MRHTLIAAIVSTLSMTAAYAGAAATPVPSSNTPASVAVEQVARAMVVADNPKMEGDDKATVDVLVGFQQRCKVDLVRPPKTGAEQNPQWVITALSCK